jgi:putative sigma-54 modulation protein
MKLQLHGVHITLTDALKERVDAQLFLPLQHLVDNDAAELEVHLCDVNGPKGGLDKECRVTLRVPGRPAVHVTERSEDLHKCIQVTHDRLSVMAKRVLERRRDSGRRQAREASR